MTSGLQQSTKSPSPREQNHIPGLLWVAWFALHGRLPITCIFSMWCNICGTGWKMIIFGAWHLLRTEIPGLQPNHTTSDKHLWPNRRNIVQYMIQMSIVNTLPSQQIHKMNMSYASIISTYIYMWKLSHQCKYNDYNIIFSYSFANHFDT